MEPAVYNPICTSSPSLLTLERHLVWAVYLASVVGFNMEAQLRQRVRQTLGTIPTPMLECNILGSLLCKILTTLQFNLLEGACVKVMNVEFNGHRLDAVDSILKEYPSMSTLNKFCTLYAANPSADWLKELLTLALRSLGLYQQKDDRIITSITTWEDEDDVIKGRLDVKSAKLIAYLKFGFLRLNCAAPDRYTDIVQLSHQAGYSLYNPQMPEVHKAQGGQKTLSYFL